MTNLDCIQDIMNDPIGMPSGTNLTQIINKLLTHQISRLIIFDSQKPEGIVSEKDILSYFYKERLNKSINDVSVNEIMKDIYFLEGTSTIFQTAKFMINKRCSSAAVGSENNLEGIVTKTDLTKHYAENLAGKYKVADHMSVNYFSVFSNDALFEVIKTMLGFGISRMVILNNQKKPIGLVSTGDIFRAVLDIERTRTLDEPVKYEDLWSRYGAFVSQPAKKVMSRGLINVRLDEDLAIACQMLIDRGINALGVEDSTGKLSGILGKRDVLLALISLMKN